MRRRLTSLLLAFTAVALTAAAREPWKWTVDERLNARFHSAARAQRLREATSANAANAAPKTVENAPLGDVIDGAVHPELFLPMELFEDAVQRAFLTQPKIFPLVVEDASDDLFRRPADWAAFEQLTRNYAHLLREEKRILSAEAAATRNERPVLDQSLRETREQIRDAGPEALKRVRAQFGAERFDRFLYTVLTRGRRSYIAAGTPEEAATTRRALRAREEKAQ